MVAKSKYEFPAPIGQGGAGPGRIAGLSGGERTLDHVRKSRNRVLGVVLASALGGNMEAARLCLELTGDLVVGSGVKKKKV